MLISLDWDLPAIHICVTIHTLRPARRSYVLRATLGAVILRVASCMLCCRSQPPHHEECRRPRHAPFGAADKVHERRQIYIGHIYAQNGANVNRLCRLVACSQRVAACGSLLSGRRRADGRAWPDSASLRNPCGWTRQRSLLFFRISGL